MPSIIKDRQQEAALEQVEELIQDTKTLNAFLEQQEMTISFGTGKKIVSRSIDKEDIEKYQALIKKAKERNGKKVNSLLTKFRIQLSEEEKKILGTEETPSQPEPEVESADCYNNESNYNSQEY